MATHALTTGERQQKKQHHLEQLYNIIEERRTYWRSMNVTATGDESRHLVDAKLHRLEHLRIAALSRYSKDTQAH